MAETEVLETTSRRIPTEDLRSLEISPETKQHLSLLQWSTNLAGSLREKTLKTGDLLAEYRKEAMLAITGFSLIALAAACGGKEIKAETVGQTEQLSPTPTVLQTETPLPSTQTPIIQETPTTTPTAEATPITTKGEEPTPIPTPTEQEKPKSNWVIEVDPKLSHISDEILEADKAIIQSVIDKFPQIGNLKIVMTSGSVSEFDPETQTIILARNYERFVEAPESFRWSVAHEIGHYLDPELNGQALSAFLTETQLDELKQLREQALADSVWGRDYPNLEKIFTPDKNKTSHSLETSRTYTPEQLATWSDLYPDAVWIGQRRTKQYADGTEVERKQVFRAHMFYELEAIENYAKEAVGISDVHTIGRFLEKPEVRAKLEPLTAKNRIFAKALELIKAKSQIFTSENTTWPALAPTQVQLEGKYVADYWKALPIYIAMVSAEAYLEGNQDFISLLRLDNRDRQFIESSLQFIKGEADEEKFAELGVVTTMFSARTSLSAFFEKLSQIQKH